jgi:aspartyl-tRNA synthetase
VLKRTHTCGELRSSHANETVTLAGWVNTYRDHSKGLVFIDLRDRYGLTQVVFDLEDVPPDVVELAQGLRREYVIAVSGTVRSRDGGTNSKLATGEIEVIAQKLEILNKSETPPILPDDHEAEKISEEVRLRNRFIDLRRPRMQAILALRSRITNLTRAFFHGQSFLEVETPLLIKSTPEGARDYVVPSRLEAGSWYALPQSPQLFKQILMIAGCDRYIQIPKCLRDEDPRADRQAEFTQIDLELSFVEREDIIELITGFVQHLWNEVKEIDVPDIPRITWRDAMERYGIDRPDTRFGLEITDISDLAAKTDFKVFSSALEKSSPMGSGVVKAFRVPKGAEKLTRKLTDGYTNWVKTFGAGGVPTTKFTENGFETGIGRFIESIGEELAERLGCEVGDQVFFTADTWEVATKTIGELRIRVARDLDMIPEGLWNFIWVVDFPMFEFDEATERWVALHHMFTSPMPGQEGLLDTDPGACISAGYDLVLNGSEIAGGSIRIHSMDVQQKVFDLTGFTREEADSKFGFLLRALTLGAPPHGGIAFGLDRLVMHLAGTDNIRDVIAFPKTQSGGDLMIDAPSAISDEQLEELHVRTVIPVGSELGS